MRIKLSIILSFVCIFSFAQDKKSKVLQVPYYTQPNADTCQSTCLKMLAHFLNVPGKDDPITQIYDIVNFHNDRPDQKVCKDEKGNIEGCNRWNNIIWWWNTRSGYYADKPKEPKLKMKWRILDDQAKTIEHIVSSIDSGVPLLVSVSNSNTTGHFVLVVGYQNYLKNQSSPDFNIVCHDPYGEFFPELQSRLFGKKRYEKGFTKADGSEHAVGAGVEIGIDSLAKFKANDGEYKDQFVLFGAE
ncbi:C39 family peptidase [uncultured Psychroserpens sp.]|uniref:C39 family peptidase n=1 Tax=uncultured Psychroserpens sp. TaxID=255436 RepID=UPI0026350FBB|nr:C39 family peptidase [uncultured Psychroserpens sp.]